MTKPALFLCALIGFFPSFSAAATESPLFAFIGISFGGEEMGELQFTDGTTSSVSSGGLVQFGGGLRHNFGSRFGIEGYFGYQADSTTASNASISMSRFTVNGGAYFLTGQIKVGGGVSLHSNVNLESSFNGAEDNFKYDNAIGPYVDFMFSTNPKFGFGMRFTSIKYKLKSINGTPIPAALTEEVKGSNANIYVQGFF